MAMLQSMSRPPAKVVLGARHWRAWRRLRHIWRRLRATGLRATLQRGAWRMTWGMLERSCGLDTRGSIDASQLGHGADSYGYQPIDVHSFQLAMRHIALGNQDVFLDYGCGKGRAVLLAALRPLQRVIGVERSAELCNIARRNLHRVQRWRRCGAVEILQCDAAQLALPDDVTIVFLYNPFTGEVMRRVVAQIHASLLRNPRNMSIVYALPRGDNDILSSCPWLTPAVCLRTAHSDWQRMTIYQPLLDMLHAGMHASEGKLRSHGSHAAEGEHG